jgi:hypothetical protein
MEADRSKILARKFDLMYAAARFSLTLASPAFLASALRHLTARIRARLQHALNLLKEHSEIVHRSFILGWRLPTNRSSHD